MQHKWISFCSVIDPSNRFIKPVIASRDHRAVIVFYAFYRFLCQFYTYLHYVVYLNNNSYFYFTFLLFQTDLTSFHITKLQSDWSSVICHRSVSDQSVDGHQSVKLLSGSVQGLYMLHMTTPLSLQIVVGDIPHKKQ